MKYTHLFFDLDHTLWDFERNSAESLAELYENHKLKSYGVEYFEDFRSTFSQINHKYWNLLDKNLITHDELRRRRFADTLNALGIEADDAFGLKLNEEFLQLLPHKPHLIDGTLEILDYLAPKYDLHIISNGWLDIQFNKMNSSKITHYFGEVITNERANARKPDPKIFEYAVGITNASLGNSLMIGDNYEADVLGAKSVGMDSVYFNPEVIESTEANYTINHLLELKNIL
ncbi:MAG: YjjG family noncanonical pyrimidine nucleotidase [Spirosomataceae bacterium]